MSAEFKMKIEGLAEFEKRIQEVPSLIKNKLARFFLDEGSKIIRDEARNIVPVDTSALRRSISYSISQANQRSEIGPTEKYGAGVEFGTPPHFVSAKHLIGWAKRKGLNPYAVAKSIAKKGTKAHPYMFPAYEKSIRELEKLIKQILDSIIENLKK